VCTCNAASVRLFNRIRRRAGMRASVNRAGDRRRHKRSSPGAISSLLASVARLSAMDGVQPEVERSASLRRHSPSRTPRGRSRFNIPTSWR